MSLEWLQAQAAEVRFLLEVTGDPMAARAKLCEMAGRLGGSTRLARSLKPSDLALYLLVLLMAAKD